MDGLVQDMRAAGWSHVRQQVDRGLQAEPGDAKRSSDPSTWLPRDNMILEAVNALPAARRP